MIVINSFLISISFGLVSFWVGKYTGCEWLAGWIGGVSCVIFGEVFKDYMK